MDVDHDSQTQIHLMDNLGQQSQSLEKLQRPPFYVLRKKWEHPVAAMEVILECHFVVEGGTKSGILRMSSEELGKCIQLREHKPLQLSCKCS